MDIRTQSSLLAAIIGLALGLSMLLRGERTRVVTRFGVFAISVGTFHLARFLEGLFPSVDGSLMGRIMLGVTLVIGAFVPSTALSFFLEFLNFSPRASRYGTRMALFSLLLGLAVGATPLAEVTVARVVVSAWVLLALSFSVSLILSRMRTTDSRIERLRLTYLLIGASASLLFTGLDFLGRYDIPFPSFGPIVSTLYLFFLSQTILRLRLMDLHELLGKIVSQALLAAILALVIVVLTAWVERNPGLYLFNTLVSAFVILILLEPLSTKVEERVVALFFRQRFAFLESGRALLRRTANVVDIPQHATILLDGLNETRRVTHVSIFLLAEDRPGFRLFDSRGPQPVSFLDAGTSRAIVSRTERAQMLETIDRRLSEIKSQPLEARRSRDELRRLNDVRSAMNQMKAGITVPLIGNDRVLGFLNLFDERVPEAFASDELAMILSLADNFATVLENSKLYERMRERDRLAALGEMAAGLAHEIRNPLGAIKGAAQCLTPEALPKDDREFVEVIVEEVNRLNGVVTAFLDYSRPLKQNFGPTDIAEVVSRTVKLIQNDIPENISLSIEVSEALPRVDGDAEQLKQVLINLVQNAVQAMPNGGSISVKTPPLERFGDFRPVDQIELHVSDTGPGIAAEQQLNIFVPFFTTKQKGTGLGLAISQRIVKNHGGTISVQSKLGEGTTFIVRLPALPSEPVAETPMPDMTPSPDVAFSRDTKPSKRDKKRRKAG